MYTEFAILKPSLDTWSQSSFTFTIVAQTHRAGNCGLMGRYLWALATFDTPIAGTVLAAPILGSWNFCNGVVGVAYSDSWDLPFPSRPITYSISSGSLPPGLSLVSADGHSAAIQGTPTTPGVYSFSLRAVNAFGVDTQTRSITIAAPAGGGGGAWTFVG